VQGAPGVFWYAPSTGPGQPVLWNLCSLAPAAGLLRAEGDSSTDWLVVPTAAPVRPMCPHHVLHRSLFGGHFGFLVVIGCAVVVAVVAVVACALVLGPYPPAWTSSSSRWSDIHGTGLPTLHCRHYADLPRRCRSRLRPCQHLHRLR
jgi:hypothetical protein